MEPILLYAIIASCAISALFVGVRAYFCYFAKNKCSHKACSDARSVELYCDQDVSKSVAEPKPEAIVSTPAKKKPGRKKKTES